MNEALAQGVETAWAVLATTPQGQPVDAHVVKGLMVHKKEAGVFATASGLVDQLSDNPAARFMAREIAQGCNRPKRAGSRPSSLFEIRHDRFGAGRRP